MNREIQFIAECPTCPPEDGCSTPKPTREKARDWGESHNDWHEELGDDRQLVRVLEVVR
jgi:hypothetical protein